MFFGILFLLSLLYLVVSDPVTERRERILIRKGLYPKLIISFVEFSIEYVLFFYVI